MNTDQRDAELNIIASKVVGELEDILLDADSAFQRRAWQVVRDALDAAISVTQPAMLVDPDLPFFLPPNMFEDNPICTVQNHDSPAAITKKLWCNCTDQESCHICWPQMP